MNKRGSSLVMTIFLVMLLSVMALSLFTIMVTDKKQVVQQEDQMQSYYLARSGAEIVAEYIINNPLDIPLLNGETSERYNYGSLGEDFEVLVSIEEVYPASGEAKTVSLKAVGYSGDREDNVELLLERITMDHAIFTEHDINLGSMDIVNGDVGSNGSITGDPKNRTGDNFEEMDMVIHTQPFPTTYTAIGNIIDNKSYTFLDQKSDVDQIELKVPSGTLTFDTSSGDIEIVVYDLEMRGDIVIVGDGRVVFYVEHQADFKNPNMTYGDPDQFIVYLDAGASLSLTTPIGFRGRIIGPEATVSISSNSTLTGSVIADYFYGTSNSNIIYDEPEDGAFVTGFRRGLWK